MNRNNNFQEIKDLESDLRFCSSEISVLYDISSTRAVELDKQLEKVIEKVKILKRSKGNEFAEYLVDIKKELGSILNQLAPAIRRKVSPTKLPYTK